jgi:hypothetical protein
MLRKHRVGLIEFVTQLKAEFDLNTFLFHNWNIA